MQSLRADDNAVVFEHWLVPERLAFLVALDQAQNLHFRQLANRRHWHSVRSRRETTAFAKSLMSFQGMQAALFQLLLAKVCKRDKDGPGNCAPFSRPVGPALDAHEPHVLATIATFGALVGGHVSTLAGACRSTGMIPACLRTAVFCGRAFPRYVMWQSTNGMTFTWRICQTTPSEKYQGRQTRSRLCIEKQQ